jgi:tight adherence protein B
VTSSVLAAATATLTVMVGAPASTARLSRVGSLVRPSTRGRRNRVPSLWGRGLDVLRRWPRRFGLLRGLARDAADNQTTELLDAFGARLATGGAPMAAFAGCLDDVGSGPVADQWARAARMMRWGSSGRAALSSVARAHPSLRWLAGAWAVTETTGASLGPVVRHLADAVRAQTEHRRAVDAELAGVRASMRLLAVLPLVGLLLGAGLGADPAEFLLASTAGRWCLLAGLLAEVAGLRWCRAIADSARGTPAT